MSIVDLSIRRPVGCALVAIGIALLGIMAFRGLPVAALPAIDVPVIVVTASLPGASPQTMASAVATPLEKRLGRIADVTALTSLNARGSTQIVVQFRYGRNVIGAATDVQQAISAARPDLPSEMPAPPTLRKINPARAPAAFIAVTSDVLTPAQIRAVVSRVVVDDLAQIPGVSDVSVQGASEPGIRVKVNPVALASVGLGLEDIARAVASATSELPSGGLTSGRSEQVLAVDSRVTTAAALQGTVVKRGGDAEVHLRDVAEIVNDAADTRVAGFYKGTPAVFVYVQRGPGTNIVEVVDAVKAKLPQIRARLPASVSVEMIVDRTAIIRGSLHDAELALLMTTILVIVTVFAFLRSPGATLVASITIPISLAGTFAVMLALGSSLDIITLTALALAVGFVVDDAVVMVENIARFRQEGYGPAEAALRGARQISFTIVTITLSLLAAFIPLFFAPDIIGVLLREFAVTLCTAILFSAATSLTLIVAFSARLRSTAHSLENKGLGRFEGAVLRVQMLYARSLAWSLLRPGLVLAVNGAVLVASVVLYVAVPKGFIPTQDTGLIIGQLEGPADISFEGIRRKQFELERILRADPAVANVSVTLGSTAIETGGAAAVNTARFFVALVPPARRPPVTPVIARLRTALRDLQGATVYLQPVQDLNVGSREGKGLYQYTLQDPDWDRLEAALPRVLERLSRLPEIADVGADLELGGLVADVQVDRDRAALLGLTPRQIDETLYSGFGQRRILAVNDREDTVNIVIELDEAGRHGPEALDALQLRAPDGSQVPLRGFATMVERRTALTVPHQAGLPSVTISFNLAEGVALGTAVKRIDLAVHGLELPETMHATFEGRAGAFKSSSSSEPLLILAALFVVYIALGILYESFVHPLTILSSLPSALVGALVALWISGTELSLIAFIGIILLIGIAKKNAIILVDFALAEQRRGDIPATVAVFRAGLLRFRPIVMTNLAAILGAVPLVAGTGAGSELRHPLGVTIMGGLLVCTVMTFYATPALYVVIDRLPAALARARRRWGRRLARPRPAAART